MNVNNLKRTQKRFNVSYLSRYKIQSYGDDNQYPQRVAAIIDGSPTGSTCLERYQTFIEGNGFDSTDFSKFICNRRGETVDDILHLVACDLGKHGGFAMHVNYNATGRITELQHIHFEDCRLEEVDDRGFVCRIAIHPDWLGEKTRNGKKVKLDDANIKKIFAFNPNPKVVQTQIISSGGIQNYGGQILWVSKDGYNQYPKPIYDKVITSLSTDEGVDNVLYRNARNNFMPAGAFVHKKGSIVVLDDDGNPVDHRDRDTEFAEDLNTFLGDTNAASIMDVTYENEEDKPEFINFRGNNFDKDFAGTEAHITEKIYAAFQQEAWYCIRIGKVGFGGDVLKDAYRVYNSVVSPQRRLIQRAFKRIFDAWDGQGKLPVTDYEIQPLVLVDEQETTITQTTTVEE